MAQVMKPISSHPAAMLMPTSSAGVSRLATQ